MSIQNKVDLLCACMHEAPQFPTQGGVPFVDLKRRETRTKYLPAEIMRNFLGGRGANMVLLYNLLQEDRDALDPEVPLIFGAGTLTGSVPPGTRGNFTSRSPDSYAFLEATSYVGLDNLDTAAAIERDFHCTERKDMALARITSAGENLVLCSGIMGGIKSIWARGGGGAKMGSLRLKAIMIQGKPAEAPMVKELKGHNKIIGKTITSTSVIKNALKQVGTPFLYKPSRVLGALGTLNNQTTAWHASLDADNFDPYRPGMDGCFKCPVQCRNQNDMTPEGKGGWGSAALLGLKGRQLRCSTRRPCPTAAILQSSSAP